MRRLNPRAVIVLCLLLSSVRSAAAQSDEYPFQAGLLVPFAVSGEFDGTDVGIGGQLSWRTGPLLGLEGEISFYPGEFAEDDAFSGGRVEGLFGATIGPRLGNLRPFVKVRPGFLTYRKASEPVACILIFPPPLNCELAAGHTLFALDIGGGIEWYPSDRTFVRVDAGDRAVRYPSPVIDTEGTARDDAFFGHDFRLAIGGGVRF